MMRGNIFIYAGWWVVMVTGNDLLYAMCGGGDECMYILLYAV